MIYWIYKDARDEWRWYLKSVDGDKIADSARGYKEQYDCKRGLNLVRDSANVPVYTLVEESEFGVKGSMRRFGGEG